MSVSVDKQHKSRIAITISCLSELILLLHCIKSRPLFPFLSYPILGWDLICPSDIFITPFLVFFVYYQQCAQDAATTRHTSNQCRFVRPMSQNRDFIDA